MPLKGRQQAIYRPLVKSAWVVYCHRIGWPSEDRTPLDAWYRKNLVDALGIYTTKEIATREQFDAVCLHFATVAGDQDQIDYWVRAPERRAMWQLRRSMGNARVNWQYVFTTAKRLKVVPTHAFAENIEKYLAELPAQHILKINANIYMYYRRKLKKKGVIR